MKTFITKLNTFYNEKVLKILAYIYKYTGLAFLVSKYQKLSFRTKHIIEGYLFVSPLIIGLGLFAFYPLYYSLKMSKSNVKIVPGGYIMRDVKFQNFTDIFKNYPDIVDALISYAKDLLITVPIVIIFALILALLLNQKIKFRGLFRMIFFFPVIILSGNMLNYLNQYGLLSFDLAHNAKLYTEIDFYFPHFVTEIIFNAFGRIVEILWLSGVQTLIFLSGLQKIDRSIYEAAQVDGANFWESFWKITFPAIIKLIVINVIYTTVVYTNLSNNPIIELINQHASSLSTGRGFAAALSWVLFGISIIVIGFYSLVVKIRARKYS